MPEVIDQLFVSRAIDVAPKCLRRVTIEVTTWCNLECSGCIRTINMKKGSWQNSHMSVECFTSVLEHLPPCELGILHGVGEPTMHPDFIELVRIAKRSGKFGRLHCNTNALARDSAYYSAIIDAGLDSFSVSVDSLSPNIAELTRCGTPIDKLQRRVTDFQKAGLPFAIQMVASRLNSDDIFSTLDSLSVIGPMTVIIQPYIDHDKRSLALTERESCMFLEKLEAWKLRLGNSNVHAGGFKGQDKGTSEPAVSTSAICTAPWFDPGISVDGFLTPCCVHWNPETLGHSSLAEKSFAALWTSAAVHKFMQAYIANPPGFCANCSENVRACSVKNSNIEVEAPPHPRGAQRWVAMRSFFSSLRRQSVFVKSTLPVEEIASISGVASDTPPKAFIPVETAIAQAKDMVKRGDVEAGLQLIRSLLQCPEDGMHFVGDPIADVAFVAAGMQNELLARYQLAWNAGIWPNQEMRAYCEYKSQCGIPPIFICTLPKSGSLYISEMIRSGLVLQDARVSLDLYPRDFLIPEMVRFVAQGGVSSWEHTDPSDRNLGILKDAGLTRFVLHLRDPRQTAVSFIHHIDSNLTGENLFYRWRFCPRIPEWYDHASFEQKVDWYLETRFAADIEWIRGWLAVAKGDEFEILITHFDDLRGGEVKYLEEILAFFKIPKTLCQFDIPDPAASAHFRSGELEEWRGVLSSRQKESMWQMIGDPLGMEMGWTA